LTPGILIRRAQFVGLPEGACLSAAAATLFVSLAKQKTVAASKLAQAGKQIFQRDFIACPKCGASWRA
jgi:4-hydroxy-3-methylbut-2-en-1-yl diphosphate synthase IspG/GcpE